MMIRSPMATHEAVRSYLRAQYEGVFGDQQIESHLQSHVALDAADGLVTDVLQTGARGMRVLDIGSGFGSFVLAARQRGLDAVGIEIAAFEVDFARVRLQQSFPDTNPESVFYLGNGLELPFANDSFDCITLWNVLEHVEDGMRLLSEANRVLRPGGYLHLICPNYAALRREAHYHIFWPPLLPRRLAAIYLRLRGRNPRFFETSIFYTTNWSVLRALRHLGMRVGDPRVSKLDHPERIGNRWLRVALTTLARLRLLWVVRVLLTLTFFNPLKDSVVLFATKKEV